MSAKDNCRKCGRFRDDPEDSSLELYDLTIVLLLTQATRADEKAEEWDGDPGMVMNWRAKAADYRESIRVLQLAQKQIATPPAPPVTTTGET